jgi:hypothetical protein
MEPTVEGLDGPRQLFRENMNLALSLWHLVCCPRWPHTDPGSMHRVGPMTSAYAPLVSS